ncbi:MAG: acyltransferase [Lachnospiraceae bacterium]|nr:acyltransferase [Lachnospiraceae bacterium]
MNSFTVDHTRELKGIAIVLMLMHHLWFFPHKIVGGALQSHFTIFGVGSVQYIGGFGKICVSLFFFLGGYGLYISYKNRRFDLIRTLKKLYISYWKVLLIFTPVAFLFFGRQPAYSSDEMIWNRFADFSLHQFFGNLSGYNITLNGEWWFFTSYVTAVITFPLIAKIIDRCSLELKLFLVVIGSILVFYVAPAVGRLEVLGTLNNSFLYDTFFCQSAPYISCFWLGGVFASENAIVRLYDRLQQHSLLGIFQDLLLIAMLVYLRQSFVPAELDILYVPLFAIACLDLFERCTSLRKLFRELGKHSTNMWLIHSFLCYYFYLPAKVVTITGNAIISLLTLIVGSYLASHCVNMIWKALGLLRNKANTLINAK